MFNLYVDLHNTTICIIQISFR